MATALIILAAGMGTRMNSELPKVLHAIAGAPMLIHAMKSGASLDPERTVIVAGHGATVVGKVAQDWDDRAEVVLQAEQLGTGTAWHRPAAHCPISAVTPLSFMVTRPLSAPKP